MTIFHFKLDPLETITPWTRDGAPYLSWFALTDGAFWIDLGGEELFRYSAAILDKWKLEEPHPDYNVAAFVRDLLEATPAALSPIPARLEALAANWDALCDFEVRTRQLMEDDDGDDAWDLWHRAWSWLGERSPSMNYLTEAPKFSLLRLQDRIRIAFDNRTRVIDGVPVWTATFGYVDYPIAFVEGELRGVCADLLAAMASRIDDLQCGRAHCQAPADIPSLRRQHQGWAIEFDRAFVRPNGVDWDGTLDALNWLSTRYSIAVPG